MTFVDVIATRRIGCTAKGKRTREDGIIRNGIANLKTGSRGRHRNPLEISRQVSCLIDVNRRVGRRCQQQYGSKNTCDHGAYP
jgi:hypothetical protein